MNKTVDINGVTTAYMEEGNGIPVVLMHGWGQNKEMMIHVFDHLKDRFRVVSLDFPGFGESGLPPEAWGVIEYEKFFEQFLETIGIDRVILIGHSFGRRTEKQPLENSAVPKAVFYTFERAAARRSVSPAGC